LSVTASVPHESTIRKLAGRLGPEVVDEIARALLDKAMRERRFSARAMRVDSTVVESDVRWPSDAALALDGIRRLAREGARLEGLIGGGAQHVQDRSRAAGRRLRLIGRTVGRRLGGAGGAREQVLKLTDETGQLVARSIREARRLTAQARAKARGRGAQRKLAAAERLERQADLAETVARQITQRLVGEKITDRLVSLADPDARPIGKGKLGKRYEFGYVFQLAELTANTRRGARGLILPAASRIGSPNENELLPTTAAELKRLGLTPREVALDGGFSPQASNATLAGSTDSPRPAGRASGWPATATDASDASATSNAPTACADPGSGAIPEPEPGSAGGSWPTTSTRWPSAPTENLPDGRSPRAPTRRNGRAPARPFHFTRSPDAEFVRGK
jgi:IS5 family transposase